jgi:hypothetical protein
MYKVMKDDKIVGISDTYPVIMGNYEIVEDKEHTCDEYEQVNGEYLLMQDVPVDYKNERIRQQRQARYVSESDPLRLDYDEALAREQEDAEEKKQAWLSSKDKIREELPYVE